MAFNFPPLPPQGLSGSLAPSRTINTLNNTNVGAGGLLSKDPNGFALDVNNDGKYEAGTDGVLAFDLNHDGTVDDKEIAQSKNILNARDNPTLSFFGREIPNPAYQQAQALGLAGDQPLSADQIAHAGGRVLVQDGTEGGGGGVLGVLSQRPKWDTYSVFNFPTGNGQRGSLSSLDPTGGYSHVSPAF